MLDSRLLKFKSFGNNKAHKVELVNDTACYAVKSTYWDTVYLYQEFPTIEEAEAGFEKAISRG